MNLKSNIQLLERSTNKENMALSSIVKPLLTIEYSDIVKPSCFKHRIRTQDKNQIKSHLKTISKLASSTLSITNKDVYNESLISLITLINNDKSLNSIFKDHLVLLSAKVNLTFPSNKEFKYHLLLQFITDLSTICSDKYLLKMLLDLYSNNKTLCISLLKNQINKSSTRSSKLIREMHKSILVEFARRECGFIKNDSNFKTHALNSLFLLIESIFDPQLIINNKSI